MSFRLVPKSVTLNDLERRNGRYFALFQRIPVASGAHCVRVHIRYLISWWVLVIFGADHWQQQVMSLWRHYDGIRTRSKVKCLFVALYNSNSTLRRSGMARVNDGSHSFTCHPHVYTQLERTMPASLLQPQSVTALWLVLIFRPTGGRRLSWPEWLVAKRGGLPARRRSLISVLTERKRRYALPVHTASTNVRAHFLTPVCTARMYG